MQYKLSQFNPELHDKFKALSVKSPHAQNIRDGKKTIELRNKNTSYRGELLICSSAKGKESGQSLALVELYDVKKVSDLTPEEKEMACVNDKILESFSSCHAWMIRNVRPTIEYPVKGQLGIYNLIYTKNCIMPYPKHTGVEELRQRISNNLPKIIKKSREERKRRFKNQMIAVAVLSFIGMIVWWMFR